MMMVVGYIALRRSNEPRSTAITLPLAATFRKPLSIDEITAHSYPEATGFRAMEAVCIFPPRLVD